MASTEQFSLRWNNFHTNVSIGFHELFHANDLADVTLSVEGRFLQAHKVVLSICSPFFKHIFKNNPCKHPVIILRDVSYGNLRDILEFMYLGEVHVLRDNLPSFLKTAELLQVKGLTGDDSSDSSSRQDDNRSDSTYDESENESQQSVEPEPLPLPLITQAPRIPPVPICNLKRPKNPFNNSKRTKSDANKNAGALDDKVECNETVDVKAETTDDDLATNNNNEIIKQLLENNLPVPDPATTQDDGMLFSMDPRGHVFCPYCYRKFVNRYNLKVHIRRQTRQ